MGRKLKSAKSLIYVFCEGESEQAYTRFLKNRFSDVAVIKQPAEPELFEDAKNRFAKDPKYKNSAGETNEIWFFFDVEAVDVGKWDQRFKIIQELRRMRKKPGIRVRLLMTSGCIEYWLMLHHKMYAPQLQTVPDKERVLKELKAEVPTYSKGDEKATFQIAENYPTAVVNAGEVLHHLLADGLPGLPDTDERNRWLYTNSKTFSTVHEAIQYLEGLKKA